MSLDFSQIWIAEPVKAPVPLEPNGPALWGEILNTVGFPGAVVAGGAIRDFYLGVKPKDIDVFVPVEDLNAWCDWKYEFLGNNSSMYDMRDTQEGQEYDKSDFNPEMPLIGVLAGEIFGYEVNIIGRTSFMSGDVQALLKSFDFDVLQRAYRDGQETILPGGSAIGLTKRVATLTHTRHMKQSLDRFMRFNNRNPGVLSLNIPFEFLEDAVNVG